MHLIATHNCMVDDVATKAARSRVLHAARSRLDYHHEAPMRTLLLLALLTPAAYATTPPKEQSQDQTQHQGQGQSATSALVDQDRRQAPAVSAPAVYASNVCAIGASGGITTPIGGISGGKVYVSESCERRELARVLTPLNPALSLKVLCADPLVKAVASPEDCVFQERPQVQNKPEPIHVEVDVHGFEKPEPVEPPKVIEQKRQVTGGGK